MPTYDQCIDRASLDQNSGSFAGNQSLTFLGSKGTGRALGTATPARGTKDHGNNGNSLQIKLSWNKELQSHFFLQHYQTGTNSVLRIQECLCPGPCFTVSLRPQICSISKITL